MEHYNFRLPSLGADMQEGRIVEWLVQPGDEITRGQIIAHLDTEKAAFDAEAFHGGKVQQLLRRAGEKVRVGEVLAIIETNEKLLPDELANKPEGQNIQTLNKIKAAPATRKLAQELGIDLQNMLGPATADRIITIDDVRRAAATPKQSTPELKSSSLQRVTANLMARSKREIPHYYLEQTLQLKEPLRALKSYNNNRPPSERVLPAALLLAAVVAAAKQVPEVNGTWEADSFHPSLAVNLGVAIAIRDGSLLALCIPNAQDLNLGELMAALKALTVRARRGSLLSSDLQPASITVSNLGEQGAQKVLGVIYPPQVALVGFGAMTAQAQVVNQELVSLPTITATLSGDHRVSNGQMGSRFLHQLQEYLNNFSQPATTQSTEHSQR